jgi:hypothetical protein
MRAVFVSSALALHVLDMGVFRIETYLKCLFGARAIDFVLSAFI